jgi:hypothetical protein
MTDLLRPEPEDPVTMAPEVTPIECADKWKAYEAQRHAWRAEHPHREVRDIVSDAEPRPAPEPAGPCKRCAGSGRVRIVASDAVFNVTCPACGGRAE